MNDQFLVFKALITENIKIRHSDYIFNNPQEIRNYHITEKKFNKLNQLLNIASTIDDIYMNKEFETVFSKGLYRAEVLYDLLNGILYFSKTRIQYESREHMITTVSTIIITSQIFGDGNHRTSMFYLHYFGNINKLHAKQVVEQIELHKLNFSMCPQINNTKEHEVYETQIRKGICFNVYFNIQSNKYFYK